MSTHTASVIWHRQQGEVFIDNKYSRAHSWLFDGGLSVAASSSPDVVPLPYSVAENVDPEEAFLASISSCHMLFFLAFAAKKGFLVNSYEDDVVGVMKQGEDGKIFISNVTLRPLVIFEKGYAPTESQIDELHHDSHERCFIANSVVSKITIQSR